MVPERTISVGVTMGDPSGVGPELCAALASDPDRWQQARIVFFADRPILERAFTQQTGERLPDTVVVVDRGLLGADQALHGVPSESGARAQLGYLEASARALLRKDIDGVVTAPVSKTQCQRIDREFIGQTEFFAKKLGHAQVVMLFASPLIRVALATTHLPLSRVPGELTADHLDSILDICVASMRRDFAVPEPRIGVVGLNPHAGEDGLLGHEEREVILPAIERARQRHPALDFSGPLVPDHAFRQPTLEAHDLLLAMYHDQGLIPLKLLDFEHTVNVTIGLDAIRTSPDHGVAYDIAGKGIADATSFLCAFDLAIDMIRNRRAASSSTIS